MDKYDAFRKHIADSAKKFQELKNETVRIISHLDCDGICAASILIHALKSQNRGFAISIVPQLTETFIKELAKEEYKIIAFTDLGSGMIEQVKEHLKSKDVVILDHHEVSGVGNDRVLHINPHMFGIEGSREVSGAGVAYMFAEALDRKNEACAHLAVVGAIGDAQENSGFERLNASILETARNQGKISVQKGLRLFGMQTRPIHKILGYSTDPYIPGVSGSESGAIQFLHNLGISPKKGKGWKKMADLSQEEMQALVAGVVLARRGEAKPEDVLGNIYILEQEEEESPLRDAKEFATLLNSCGRMGKASLGIGACLGDPKMKRQAISHLLEYRREIIAAMQWFEAHRGTAAVQEHPGYMIISAGTEILSTMIGTIASMIAKSNTTRPGTIIISMAEAPDKTLKASIRRAGFQSDGSIDLRSIMEEITSRVDGSSTGGHIYAAGSVIPQGKEKEFLEAARDVLGKLAGQKRVPD